MLRPLIDQANRIRCEKGNIELFNQSLRFIYDRTIRKQLPITGYRMWNGVRYDHYRLLDDHMPWSYPPDRPNYESALIRAVRESVKNTDQVGIIGGGLGISSVAAAQQTGAQGKVIAYEASATRIRHINNTLRINNAKNIVEVHHALVGPDIKIIGNIGNPTHIPPKTLPEFDVIEMDCEGAELEILKNIEQTPRRIIVETHGIYDSTQNEVAKELHRLGYEIVDSVVDQEDKGVYVLTAEHKRNTRPGKL